METLTQKYPVLKLKTAVRKLPADTTTPVGLYLKLRDRYPGAVLLECADYHSREDSCSFIAVDPIASFRVDSGLLEVHLPDFVHRESAGWETSLATQLREFSHAFKLENPSPQSGFFGHTSFEAARHFDTISFNQEKDIEEVPDMHYRFFRYVIMIDHFRDVITLIEHRGEETSGLDDLEDAIHRPVPPPFPFMLEGEERSNMSDEDFLRLVELGKSHCQRGDVFQLVLSRRFSRSFKGDEFNVYRRLRSVNPSPYLFYFDFGDYRLFGSSPEAQLIVKNNIAQIHPIAGTVRRTGNDLMDAAEAEKLAADPKENAEHVMLVDLARNDLARHGTDVKVSSFREIQHFSHVIHLVSKVEAKLDPKINPIEVFGATFPAGTLSGAPKIKALELISEYEPHSRGFYGGAIGFFGFDGSINHAIAIRTFLSRNGALEYQAGAGIVIGSDPQSELEEVINKLGALRSALESSEKNSRL